MEGGNGGGGSCWSYREETGSVASTDSSSSRSGTIVSTAYTSSTSRHSIMSAETAAMLLDLEIYGEEDVPREDTEEEDIRSLAHEFFVGVPLAAYCSANGGDMSVLERWFTELGVSWVLELHLTDTDGASAGTGLLTSAYAQIWIRALGKIMKTIRSSAPLLAQRSLMGVGLASICEEGEEAESNSCSLDKFQFTQFVKETVLKMVAFVDIIVHLDCNTITCENLMANGAVALYQKISILLLVHNALSDALSQIKVSFLLLMTKMPFLSPAYTEIGRIWDEMLTLLHAKDVKVCDVIWGTLGQISTRIMELMEDMAATITPQGSFEIHKVTRSAVDHITFLLDNHSTLVSVIYQAKSCLICFDGSYFIQNEIERSDTLDSIIMKMASSLEETIVSLSKSFSDQGLGFLFVLNNLYFMQQELKDYHLEEFDFLHLICKVNEYMSSYLDVFWAPVLSCLLDPTPLCFHKNYSLLSKFESEFQKIYTTHKMWKVPNPELRKKLRIAITKKIVPSYTRYIEDNNVATAKVGPRELEEMLQDLFEG